MFIWLIAAMAFRLGVLMQGIRVLQLCHDAKGPFVPLCSMYSKAMTAEGCKSYVAFLRGCQDPVVELDLAESEVHFFNLSASEVRGLKLRAVLKVILFCRREKIDLIIAHRYKAIYVAGLASRFLAVSTWGVAHGHDVFKRLGRRLFLRYIAKELKVVGISQTVVDDILADCSWLEAGSHVFSLPNCLDEKLEEKLCSMEEARKVLGLSSSDYVYGSIGRLVPSKSHHLMIRALSVLGGVEKLVIIGDGSEMVRLRDLAISLGVEDRVLLVGNIDKAFTLMKAFDAFIFSPNESEGFGLVLLEAMIARVPIVSSDSAGPLEVVADTGFIFQMGDVDQLAASMKAVRLLTLAQLNELTERAYQRWRNNYSLSSFRRDFYQLLTRG